MLSTPLLQGDFSPMVLPQHAPKIFLEKKKHMTKSIALSKKGS